MKRIVLIATLLFSAHSFAKTQSLVGTWLLEHSENTLSDGTVVPYCTGAHGMITYTNEGFVSVALNCAPTGNGKEPADSTGRKFSYAGTYHYNGRQVTHDLMNA